MSKTGMQSYAKLKRKQGVTRCIEGLQYILHVLCTSGSHIYQNLPEKQIIRNPNIKKLPCWLQL